MAKMGRPKSDKPKLHLVGVRLTDEEHEKLLNYALSNNLTITKAVKKGLDLLYKSS